MERVGGHNETKEERKVGSLFPQTVFPAHFLCSFSSAFELLVCTVKAAPKRYEVFERHNGVMDSVLLFIASRIS